jgi:tetratricopeptide (TPR) repeat protein
MKKVIFLLLLVFCPGAITATYAAGADPGLKWYQKGKQALSKKQYSKAIGYFNKASGRGYDNARLHHAWGAALYKTKQYDKARTHFRKALEDPKFSQLACLNLGLVALKQNRNDEAVSWFTRAKEKGDSRKVSLLAGEMLNRMRLDENVNESILPEATVIYLSTRVGYEDKAYSATLDQIGDSDQFLELNLYASTRLAGNSAEGFNINFNGYSLQNRESQDTEVSVATLQLGYYKNQTQWQAKSGLGVTPSYVAGDPYTRAINADVELRYRISAKTSISGLLDYESARAAKPDVDYAAGQGIKGRLRLKHSSETGLFYLTGQYEQYDRHDRIVGGDFYSYSPTRQSIRLKYRYLSNPAWRLETSLRYRRSQYADPNRIGGEVKRRIENQFQAVVTLGYVVSPHATLQLGIEHTDNQSTWDRYTYQRNAYTVGMEWLFL